MFYGNSIETIVKEYNGEDLCKLNIEFDEENYNTLANLSVSTDQDFSERANLLWAYVCLHTNLKDYTLLEKFYDIVGEKEYSSKGMGL